MSQQARPFSHLVVIGASSGGIESLSAIVGSLSRTFAAPIVIAQHLSPDRVSVLGDILGRRSVLPVRTVHGVEPLEAGVIYVVPPGRDVIINDHEVALRQDGTRPQPSIDLLFTSASQVFAENLIAVVLSGSGSDGSVGAREVKFAGGTVVIENPDTASYAGMPLSLAPSVVDIVANRDRIAEILNDLVSGSFIVPAPSTQSHLQGFLEELRDESGIDFTSYKPATIERRLQRRMVATSQPSVTDYVRYVHAHPDERRRLINSFLIKVTEFFRDPDTFSYLSDHVLPELIREAKARDGDLRIWSAGCATGEEAYSVAMLVHDLLGDDRASLNVRIFATDLDEEAIAFARRGIYPARALASLPQSLIQRHFAEYGEDYEVRKPLRSMLVFGEHDLGQRAPFPRIDLILCRNVLIYFTPALQRRALQLFAFSLRPGGYLALGKSETVSPLAEFFTVDQPRLKVFRRIGNRALIPPSRIRDAMPIAHAALAPTRQRAPTPLNRPPAPTRDSQRLRTAWQGDSLLLAVSFGLVVVDRSYDIQYINSEARRLLGIHASAIEQDLIHAIQYFDPMAVRRVVDAVFDGETPEPLALRTTDDLEDARQTVELIARHVAPGRPDAPPFAVITLIDVTEREELRRRQAHAEQASARLMKANDDLLASNQDLNATITKLRAENEEMLVASEEIQAATEEVETLNEELQASNEELETLNEELQATVEELNTTNDDLQARTLELQTIAIEGESTRHQLRTILDSLDVAVVVLDAAGEIILENARYKNGIGNQAQPGTFVDEAGNRLSSEHMPLHRAHQGAPYSGRVGFRPGGADTATQWLIATAVRVPERDGVQFTVVSFRPAT